MCFAYCRRSRIPRDGIDIVQRHQQVDVPMQVDGQRVPLGSFLIRRVRRQEALVNDASQKPGTFLTMVPGFGFLRSYHCHHPGKRPRAGDSTQMPRVVQEDKCDQGWQQDWRCRSKARISGGRKELIPKEKVLKRRLLASGLIKSMSSK